MDIEDLIRSGKIKRFFRATRKLNVPQLVLHARLPKRSNDLFDCD
jgi:hypothetical protein